MWGIAVNPLSVETGSDLTAAEAVSADGTRQRRIRELPPKHIPLESVAARATEVSTLPHVALKVMEVARNPESGAADLKVVVEGDPTLSARVLRTVNSAAYALRTKITNLHQAVSLLGFDQIRNLAITASVSDSFKNDSVTATYRRSGLWRHLVSTGICARLIATRCRLSNFEDAFLAGLLHDFGIIIEDQHAANGFRAALRNLEEGRLLSEVEQEYLGFDHTTLGATVAEAWKFPPAVQAAIRFHHASGRCDSESEGIVRCVEVANYLCSLKGISSIGMNLVAPPYDAIKALSFNKEDLKVLVIDLDEEMIRYEGLYHI